MASGQERTWWPFPQVGEGQRIPEICFNMEGRLTPDRRASDINRPVASIWEEAHPQVLPIWAKTSQIPFSSELMVTYSLPHPVEMRSVIPRVRGGLGLGLIFEYSTVLVRFRTWVSRLPYR